MSENKEELGGIENIVGSYNEMKAEELVMAISTLAITLSTYYKELSEKGVDLDTARILCVTLQQSLIQNVKYGDKP